MKHLKSIAGFCLTASLMCQIPVYAQIPDGYDEQTWERLNDNHLEYDEIEDLIVNFSLPYLSSKNEMEKAYGPYETAAEDMRGIIDDWRDELRKAKEDGDEDQIAIYKKMINGDKDTTGGNDVTKGLEKAVKAMKGATDRTLNTSVKGALVTGTESYMVAYQRLNSALEIMDASVNLSEAAYNSTVTQQGLGMATADDVAAAQESLLSARMQQQSTQTQSNQIKQNLCMLTGWEYDADVAIGSVPEPDESRIAAMNPETDIETAIGNNYTLVSMRHTNTSSGKTASEKRSRLEQMEEMEEKIGVAINQQYQNVLQTQAAFQAASSAYESAKLTFGATQRQYQLGMISSLQYQQLNVAYLSEKMNFENARLDFFQAMENYDWAVKGNLSLE